MAEQGLGADIREVYTELGALATIVSRDPVVTGERVIYEINAQATKPFIREHHLDATLPYDTQVEPGDVLLIIETDKYYMAMNKTPEVFENSVVEYNVVLYLCNLPTTAHIIRPVEVRSETDYNIVHGWTVVVDSPVYGLISDRVFGSEITQAETGAGQFPVYRIDLYLPKSYGVQPLDRFYVSATEYYKVETVENYYYPGVCVCMLVEDTRPENVDLIEDEDEYGDY